MHSGLVITISLAILLQNAAQLCESLSVTNYGSKRISMLRHGEKYATNRPCYSWEDVQPKYHGMTHIRGNNDKRGSFTFNVDVPVFVYLAVDSRYPYIHGAAFENTSEKIMLGGCHPRTPFYIYKSKQALGPGPVTVNFKAISMSGVFVRDARLVQPAAELKIVPLTARYAELSMVRDGEKFSTNRRCYKMIDIPPRFYGLTHVRLLNDETSFSFHINVPAVVYVAIDSRRSRHLNVLPSSFVNTGEKIIHAGCHPQTDFPVFAKRFNPGNVVVNLGVSRMIAVFVEPLVDNTFKTGVY
ncbi:uncharacterized protein LOC114523020 [Dendronephthya gigantea]|uniref:uncharacterized protein LOC114523020 n=1 Tax=Dendronephthya gigantea TaxID=151771 RepID=UPI00106D1638|nr:uncharacterized protein LOC114523020 [Dendronephthya gigantea]